MTNKEYIKSVAQELQDRNIPHALAAITGETEENYECVKSLYGPGPRVHGLVHDLMKHILDMSTSK